MDLAHDGSSYPAEFITFNNEIYFRASDGIHGTELCRFTPGQEPELVADIYRGDAGSEPSQFAISKNKLYFRADGGLDSGRELWEYDGVNTPRLVADIRPGWEDSYPKNLFAFEDVLYFAAQGSSNNWELWAYDGLEAPYLVADLYQSTDQWDSSSNPANFTEYKGKLYFTAFDGTGIVMWTLDEAGKPVRAFSDGGRVWIQLAAPPFVWNEKLYFSAAESSTPGIVFWAYDGSNPPEPVLDRIPVPSDPNQVGLNYVVYRGALYYDIETENNDELWRYDGINPPERVLTFGSAPGATAFSFFVFNDAIYFLYDAKTFRYSESDQLQIAPNLHDLNPGRTFPYEARIYFSGEDVDHGREVWAYDGISDPQVAADIHSSFASQPRDLVWFNQSLVFSTTNVHDRFFALKDGQAAPVLMGSETAWNRDPAVFTHWNGSLYLLAGDGVYRTLFRYDGSASPVLIGAINYNSGSIQYADYPDRLVPYKGSLYFGGHDGANGYELWKYDGQAQLGMVHDINQINHPLENSSFPRRLTVFNDLLYFTANDGVHGEELWRYDGVNDPELAFDVNPTGSTHFGDTGEIALLGSRMLLSMNAGLWEYDGTHMPRQINAPDPEGIQPFLPPHNPTYLTPFEGKLYFAAFDATEVGRLWVYDGTNPPALAFPSEAVSLGRNPQHITAHKDGLCFSANDENDDHELWCFKPGHEPIRIADINPNGSSFPKSFLSNGDELFFAADDGFHGEELWRHIVPFSVPVEAGPRIPSEEYTISEPYPNPTQSSARMAIRVSKTQRVHAAIYDMLGRHIATVLDAPLAVDTEHVLEINLKADMSGLYICRIVGEYFSVSKRIVLTR